VTDTETGELFEVLDADLISDSEPYDYAGFRRMCMTISAQHRKAIADSRQTGVALARAEAEYHRQLAITIPRMKAEHGATGAEALAKGEPDVKAAKEARDIAAAVDRAAMETVRLVRSDRDAAQAMGYWSRESASAGWEK
jgi:hypothetical protein